MNFKAANKKQLLGFIYVLIAAICFSSKGVLVKLAYVHHIDATSLLFFRMLFSFPIFLSVAIWTSYRSFPKESTPKQLGTVFSLGIIGYYLSSLFDFIGLEYVSAGLERLVLFIYPTLVAVLSAIFYKRAISKVMYVSLAITYAGILLVVVHDVSVQGPGLLVGIGYILVCALTFAIYLVMSDKLVHIYGSVLYTSFMMIASSIGIFTHFFIVYPFQSIFEYPQEIYVLGIMLAIVATVIPSYLMTDGIQKIGARTTSITATLGPVSTIVLAHIFLNEEITVAQVFGTVLVIGGVLVANFAKGEKN